MPEPVVPSSASVTVILYGILSPNAANWPFSGISIVTCGRVLPTTTVTLLTAVRPPWSVTLSTAVYVPAVAYVWVGLASVESTVPSLSKSQA